MKKTIAFTLAAMVLSLTACGSNEPTNKAESSGISLSENPIVSQEISTDVQVSEATNSENSDFSPPFSHTGSNAESSSPEQAVNPTNLLTTASAGIQATQPASRAITAAVPTTAETIAQASPTPPNSVNSGSNQPTEPEKPAGHVHNWVKEPKGLTVNWQGVGPDENGYTSNMEIAEDKNGKKVSINMCATCYEYFGIGDVAFDRYWEHSNKMNHGGYSTYRVYAVYDVYFCEECTSYKRGGFSFYGYYDYSRQNNPQWIYLTATQIAELNLPIK